MRILTSNVRLEFKCDNDSCEDVETIISDPIEMTESGVPICPHCSDRMVIEPECIIKN